MAKPGTFGTDTRFVEQGDFCTCLRKPYLTNCRHVALNWLTGPVPEIAGPFGCCSCSPDWVPKLLPPNLPPPTRPSRHKKPPPRKPWAEALIARSPHRW